MKRKYFLLVLFLILAIFFTINTTIVNAKMYKILDSGGNIVGLTNIPILSIKEEEAGYTISPPPEGQEITQEAPSKGNNYDFLNTKWGMSKEEVKKMEKAGLTEDNRWSGEDNLEYQGKVDGFDCKISYFFREGKLVRTGCAIIQPMADKSVRTLYGCYDNIKNYFIKKYGEIFKSTESGYRYSWDTSVSKVDLSFINNTNSRDIDVFLILIDCRSKFEHELNLEK
jgi:hypothetical protein